MADERILELDKYEYGCIFKVMNEKRNALKAAGENTDFVDDILLKLADASYKKVPRKKEKAYEAARYTGTRSSLSV